MRIDTIFTYSCPIHVVNFTLILISILATDYIQKRRVEVNLCQKLLFLHQLTHNMTTDCSLFMKSTEYLQNMLCTQIVVFVLFWHSEQFWYTTCSADVASFWKRFTCIKKLFHNANFFVKLSVGKQSIFGYKTK